MRVHIYTSAVVLLLAAATVCRAVSWEPTGYFTQRAFASALALGGGDGLLVTGGCSGNPRTSDITSCGGAGSGGSFYSDAFHSVDGGTTWQRYPQYGWTARAQHAMALGPRGDSVWLYGGITASGVALNDVWSTSLVRNKFLWLQLYPVRSGTATPGRRYGHAMLSLPLASSTPATPQLQVMIVGGLTDNSGVVARASADVWVSPWDPIGGSGGYNFVLASNQFDRSFGPRWGHALVAFGFRPYLLGGFTELTGVGVVAMNDVWVGTADGTTWSLVTATAAWTPRAFFGAAVYAPMSATYGVNVAPDGAPVLITGGLATTSSLVSSDGWVSRGDSAVPLSQWQPNPGLATLGGTAAFGLMSACGRVFAASGLVYPTGFPQVVVTGQNYRVDFNALQINSSMVTPPLCPAGSVGSCSAQPQVCTVCLAGSFSAQPGSFSCQKCSVGTYAAHDNSTSCLPCPSGTFADSEASQSCALCPAGTYSAPGAAACYSVSPNNGNNSGGGGGGSGSDGVPVYVWALLVVVIAFILVGVHACVRNYRARQAASAVSMEQMAALAARARADALRASLRLEGPAATPHVGAPNHPAAVGGGAVGGSVSVAVVHMAVRDGAGDEGVPRAGRRNDDPELGAAEHSEGQHPRALPPGGMAEDRVPLRDPRNAALP